MHIKEIDGVLKITLNFEKLESNDPWKDPESKSFFLLSWGKRRYLVRKKDFPTFCWCLNFGGDPADVAYEIFLKVKDDYQDFNKKMPTKLPFGYDKYIHKKPVNGTVEKILEAKKVKKKNNEMDLILKLAIKTSKAELLCPGMLLVLLGPGKQGYNDVKIIAINKNSVTALFKTKISHGKQPANLPKPGWKVTSIPSWRWEEMQKETREKAKKKKNR